MGVSNLAPIFLLLIVYSTAVESYMVNGNPYRQREMMDKEGDYMLEWEYMPGRKTIIFNVTVRTEGFVGLGLANTGSMMNADFIIAGVHRNQPYVKDMHTKGNRNLIEDRSQDWTLLEASEDDGITRLRFARPISTCDEDDVEITKDHIVILWAFGETDKLSYHYQNRGTMDAYLLDPNMTPELRPPPRAPGLYGSSHYNSLKFWSLRRNSTLQSKPTQYLSTIHRGPQLSQKHHIIGSRTYLGNEATRRHSHHLVLYRCNAPEGINPNIIFEPFVNYPGEEHYFSENRRLPTEFCLELISVWGIGGKPYFFDDSVGLPIGGRDEYLLLQVHFDNGDMREPTPLEVGVDLFITPARNSERSDGRYLIHGFNVPAALTAYPPASIDFSMIGHCDSQCAQNMFPPKGVKASGIFLHSHRSGRKLSLRHFRKGVELEPVLSDDNYDPSYQQYRQLEKEVTFLQGDHFVMQCELDNTQVNGTTVGGFGTHQEMCLAFIIISSVIYNDRCVSEYPAYRLLNQMGVDNVTWDTFLQDRVVTSPRSLRGLTLGQVGDRIKWTSAKRRELENDMLYAAHPMLCPTSAIPSAQEILQAARSQQQTIPSTLGRIPLKSTTTNPPPFKFTPGVGFSFFGFGGNNNNNFNNAGDLQSQVQRAARQQLQQGSLSLLRMNDPGSIIMRASTGSPFIEERTPAIGISQIQRIPATAKLPRNAPEYRGNEKDTCERKGFGYDKYQIPFWQVGPQGTGGASDSDRDNHNENHVDDRDRDDPYPHHPHSHSKSHIDPITSFNFVF